MSSRCDAVAVVRERVRFWAPLAEDQGRPLEVDLPAVPAPVPLDEVDLRDVIDVLVDNVFAHTPEGTPFRVVVRREGDVESRSVRIVVADEGPGPGPRPRPGPGHTGLGLEIVRRTVEPAGGDVEIGAAPEGGTVVGVRLPLGPGD
jgi:signal transduction histidine kinase